MPGQVISTFVIGCRFTSLTRCFSAWPRIPSRASCAAYSVSAASRDESGSFFSHAPRSDVPYTF